MRAAASSFERLGGSRGAYGHSDDCACIGGSRFEIAETPVIVPPELQCLQTADAARSQFASRYLAYRHPLQFSSDDPGDRCDTYYLSPWMVMAVVDVGSVDRFESPLQGQDIVEFHYRISGGDRDRGLLGRVPPGRARVAPVVPAEGLRRRQRAAGLQPLTAARPGSASTATVAGSTR